jgi:hypothetical protein
LPTTRLDARQQVTCPRASAATKLSASEAPAASTQLTFGTHDEGGPQFLDASTLVFASTAINPAEPIDPEVAKNGQIYNLWTLDLKTSELKQYTDALSGNLSPVVLNKGGDGQQVAFVSYYKGDYSVHVLDKREPIGKATTEDFGSAGPIIDFQAPLTHTLVADNQKRKGKFEKLFLEGRPPVKVGITSAGDYLGGTAIAFTDVLGDQQFTMYATSVSQYRRSRVVHQPRTPLPVRHPGLLADAVLLRAEPGHLLRPGVQRLHRPRPRRGHDDLAWRHRLRHLALQPLSPHRDHGRHLPVAAALRGRQPRAVLTAVSGSAVRAQPVQQLVPFG